MTRRAAIYVRISRDKTGAGLGVERQEEDCRALAERLGWDVVKVYADNDLSAYQRKKPRPGYRSLLRDLRAGHVDAVLAWHTDRLNRRMTELEELITLLEDRDVTVATVTAGDLDLSTASGRRNARIYASIAQGEVEQARERVRRSKLQAARDGRYRGGVRPFGFEGDGVTIREDEAAVLRRASSEILEGRSIGAIVKELNAAGVTTSTGKRWTQVNLRPVLMRARNAGLVEREGEIIGRAMWPAIVPEDTWRALVALLSDPSRRTNTHGPAPRYLGSGIYRCGECGAPVHVMRTAGRKGEAGTNRYRCSMSAGHVSRLQEAVDDLVRRTVAERLAQDDAADLLAIEVDPEPLAAARERAQALRVREDELAELFATGAVSASQLAAGTEKLRTERLAAEREIAAASEHLSLGWLATAPDPAEAFLTASLDRQRAVVEALLEVTIVKAPRGRPVGWRPGDPQTIRPEYIVRKWRDKPVDK